MVTTMTTSRLSKLAAEKQQAVEEFHQEVQEYKQRARGKVRPVLPEVIPSHPKVTAPVEDAPIQDPETMLKQLMAECRRDFRKFVMLAFPWGSGELKDYTGPNEWQLEVMSQIKSDLSPDEALRIAVASGHGIGKSAMVAWIILWAMSTCPNTKGVVTANTEVQLRTKTWAELAKWSRQCITRHWFKLTATALFSTEKETEKTWRIDQVPWSLNNTEAFAGLHNQGSRVLLVMDEASAIPDKIWEVAEGALTDANTEIMWFAFGNPTRNEGRFRECFGKFRERWKRHQVDSRKVPFSNLKQIQEWADDYGEDSDFFRVRVRGEFPVKGTDQFFSTAAIETAMKTKLEEEDYSSLPIILGLDVARFGEDSSVLCMRQGRFVKILGRWNGASTTQVAERTIRWIEELDPDAVVVDIPGVGGGVFDHLVNMGYAKRNGKKLLHEFNGSWGSTDQLYHNRRTECYGLLRDAIAGGLSLPDDRDLRDDLVCIGYRYHTKTQKLILESKDEMRANGFSSPDCADSVSITFHVKVSAEAREARAKDVLDDFSHMRRKRSTSPDSWMR